MSSIANSQTVADAENAIIQWAQRDEHKSRLAVLHAGCLFWHIRRYSMRAFYEPNALYLATLVLWAYSVYTSHARRSEDGPQSQIRPSGQVDSDGIEASGSATPDSSKPTRESSADPEPTFIRLDRPCDDEMVQLFVRAGRPDRMKANISGVGDICSTRGPSRLLREGRKILLTLASAWGCSWEYVTTLEGLEAVMNERVLAQGK